MNTQKDASYGGNVPSVLSVPRGQPRVYEICWIREGQEKTYEGNRAVPRGHWGHWVQPNTQKTTSSSSQENAR